jgi:gamma-glutamylcyclotransferase (GGCT)/AIG2-like uncharacterized protein YtfP
MVEKKRFYVMTNLLAVYGSLRQKMGASHLLKDIPGVEYEGEDTVTGTLYDLGWFPGLKLNGNNKIIVEVYRVAPDHPILAVLNTFEGYYPENPKNSLFILRKTFLNSNGKEAMCYEYNRDASGRPIVKSGDWASYVSERNSRKAS